MSHPGRPAAKSVAELIGGAIDPLVRKRGLARAEMMAWWPDIVGETYAGYVVPERIRWPRDGTGATLIVRCDPAMALQFSYEADRVRERLNSYFGYSAVGKVRIVQHRMADARGAKWREPPAAVEVELPEAVEKRLAGFDGPLQESFRRLGKAILAGS